MAFKRSSNSAGGLQVTFDSFTPAQKAAFQASVSGDKNYEVVVYGATPSGIAAAVTASKAGRSVLLVSRYPWIGGMMAGGLSVTDITPSFTSALTSGRFNRRYFNELSAAYGQNRQRMFSQYSWSAMPSVHEGIFRRLLAETTATVATSNSLVQVHKTGTKVTRAVFSGIGGVAAQVFIDASYEGDLLALAGATTRIGREANSEYGETANGIVAYSVNQTQFGAAVDPYVTPGNPASGLLPGMWSEPYGNPGDASPYVMAFNYRLTMTTGTGVAMPEPDNYDPLQYELLGRHIAAYMPTASNLQDFFTGAQIGLITNQYDVNNKICVSTNYISPVCTEYITATPARRLEIEAEIRQYTLGLFKFLRTDSRVPAAARASVASVKFMQDEFVSTGGFSRELYVREGRRLVGDFVLTQAHVTGQIVQPDVIAFNNYEVDAHNARRVVRDGYAVNEGRLALGVGTGGHIPLRIVMPKLAELTNVMATFACSVTHVAFCETRMEPIQMSIGEAAGAVAAEYCRAGYSTVQGVPYSRVLPMIDPYGLDRGVGAVTVDAQNTLSGGTVTTAGTWTTAVVLNHATVGGYIVSSAAGATADFAPNLPSNGWYDVFAKWPNPGSPARSTATVFTVTHATGSTVITQNQNNAGDVGDWGYLGRYQMLAGTPSTSKVRVATDGVGGSSVINAVKFVPVLL